MKYESVIIRVKWRNLKGFVSHNGGIVVQRARIRQGIVGKCLKQIIRRTKLKDVD